MSSQQSLSLEEALSKAEKQANESIKTVQSLNQQLKRYLAAAKVGDIRALKTAGENIEKSLDLASQSVSQTAKGWNFNEQEYLSDGRFFRELIASAKQVGVQIHELDGRIYCYPSLLSVSPIERSVRMNKRREARIRPSVLVKLLSDNQKKSPKFKPAEFLESLYDAYQKLSSSRAKEFTKEPTIALAEIYDLLTLLPGSEKEYPTAEFARDVYLLENSDQKLTRDGAKISFHAATGTKSSRRLEVVTKEGDVKTFYAIRFSKKES